MSRTKPLADATGRAEPRTLSGALAGCLLRSSRESAVSQNSDEANLPVDSSGGGCHRVEKRWPRCFRAARPTRGSDQGRNLLRRHEATTKLLLMTRLIPGSP